MARRIVEVVELCEHGARDPHIVNVNQLQHEYECVPDRRVLDPGSYVLVEKVDGEWPAEAKRRIVNDMHGRRSIWYDTVDRLLDDLRDALAGGEQP